MCIRDSDKAPGSPCVLESRTVEPRNQLGRNDRHVGLTLQDAEDRLQPSPGCLDIGIEQQVIIRLDLRQSAVVTARKTVIPVEAHHGDVEPKTVIAVLVQAADAVSAARPGARRENVENYIRRLEKLEELTGSYPGVEKAYAIQAGREVRIMVKPEEVTEDNMILLARDIARKIEAELEYPGQIKVNVIRETRSVELSLIHI